MSDRLTQLQDAVDQLATQFVATFNYINTHHDLSILHPGDEIRPNKKEPDVTPHPPTLFLQSLLELSQDLITKEQQIEALIHSLPGLNHSEQHQEQRIRELQEELVVVEGKRREAVGEKERILKKLDGEIMGVRRP